MTHVNAPLTPEGRRRLAVLIVEQGWPVRRVAERFQISPATASKWARRLERRIIGLRFTRRWGPHRIGYHLGVPRSTVGRVLTRYRMPLLAHLDQATGLPVRRPKPIRYEASTPGELVHVDIKKLGRIPDGGGHRKLGRTAANRIKEQQRPGYAYLHHAVDSYSRLVYSEQLTDERKETAAGFWKRARTFFADAGFNVTAVMTDNGSCYRSHVFADALGDGVKHRRTRPYRPQTNGKVERFNRTIADEWAYAQIYTSDQARAATYANWLHDYNHHRPHTGIGGQVPADRVHNLTGNYN